MRNVARKTAEHAAVSLARGKALAKGLKKAGQLVAGNGTVRREVAKEVAEGAAKAARKTAAELADIYEAAKKAVYEPAKLQEAYEAYKKRKKAAARDYDSWLKGYSNTADGRIGEHQADIAFANEGHTKLDGPLTPLDAPAGKKGLDGVWRNATPPPEYIVTETKLGGAKLDKATGQMSDDWIRNNVKKSFPNDLDMQKKCLMLWIMGKLRNGYYK